MKKNELRKIPIKNYFILIVVAIVTIVLTLYINEWIKMYNTELISVSPLKDNVNELNSEELKVSLSEINEVILYVGYTNDKEVYDMETKLLKNIKNKDLVSKLVYLNINDYKENEAYLELLKSKFPEVKESIKKAPLFIYIKNGGAVSVINSNKKIVGYKDFNKLVEIYELND